MKLLMGKDCEFMNPYFENWLSSKKLMYVVTAAPSQGSQNTEKSFVSGVEVKSRKGSWFSAPGRRWQESP